MPRFDPTVPNKMNTRIEELLPDLGEVLYLRGASARVRWPLRLPATQLLLVVFAVGAVEVLIAAAGTLIAPNPGPAARAALAVLGCLAFTVVLLFFQSRQQRRQQALVDRLIAQVQADEAGFLAVVRARNEDLLGPAQTPAGRG